MAEQYLDRYKRFKSDEDYQPIPGIKIPQKSTDKTILYKLGSTRFDNLSNDYYDSPYFGWLIMLANPQYGGLEFNIPNNAPIRVPFPFVPSVNDYLDGIEKYKRLYG
jgi:hypothetical protein